MSEVLRADARFPSARAEQMIWSSHVARLVAKLPDAIFAPGTPAVLVDAGIESFYLNVRKLIDFLGMGGDSPGDIYASDVCAEWEPPTTGAMVVKFRSYRRTASKQVAHFTSQAVRVEDGAAVQNVTPTINKLRKVAADVLTVWDLYAAKVNHPLTPLSADL